MQGLANGILATAAALAAGTATAADLPTKKEQPPPAIPLLQPSPWRFELTGYGWGTSIAGNVGFGALPTLQYYAPFSEVLQHLEAAFMGSVVARNGTYILGLDTIWSRIGGSGTVRVKDAPLGTDLTVKEGIITAFGGLRIPIGPPNFELYGTVGARYMYTSTKLTVTGPLGFLGVNESVTKDWVDPVAGFAAQYRFNDRWFMNVLGDVGGWSDSATGQALASVGYNWTQNWSTTLGYRVLYTYEKQDTGFNYLLFEPRSFRYQQWLYGPFVGVKFSF